MYLIAKMCLGHIRFHKISLLVADNKFFTHHLHFKNYFFKMQIFLLFFSQILINDDSFELRRVGRIFDYNFKI